MVPYLSQINTVHTVPPLFLLPILILLSNLSLSLTSGLFPSGFATIRISRLPMHSPYPTHLIHVITLIIFGEGYNI